MRILGCLVFLVGLVLSFGSQSLTDGFTYEIGRYSLYEHNKFLPNEVELGPNQAPVGVTVLVSDLQGLYSPEEREFTLVAKYDGETVFTNAVTFQSEDAFNPDSQGDRFYVKDIGKLTDLLAGKYNFLVESNNPMPTSIRIILKANVFDFSIYGTIALWLGAALFILGIRRRNRAAANAPSAPSKWGRGP